MVTQKYYMKAARFYSNYSSIHIGIADHQLNLLVIVLSKWTRTTVASICSSLPIFWWTTWSILRELQGRAAKMSGQTYFWTWEVRSQRLMQNNTGEKYFWKLEAFSTHEIMAYTMEQSIRCFHPQQWGCHKCMMLSAFCPSKIKDMRKTLL